VVAAFDRSWLRRPVRDLAGDLGIRADRVSRLKAKLLAKFEAILDRCLRRGRPPKDRAHARLGPRLAVLEALVRVAADVLAAVPIRARDVQDRMVAARDRLARDHELSHRQFAEMLGLSERTLRHWAMRPPAPPCDPERTPSEPKPKRRPDRTPRFALEENLPGLQVMGDTTNWSLFGVDLKIVALQDPGHRHRAPLERFAVDDHEDHRIILEVVRDTIGDRPGMQLLTDQGTPYLASNLIEELDRMGIEHAPQREGDGTEKATLERAFRTVKDALRPLSELTAAAARAVPSLRRGDLAKAVGHVVLATFLNVWRLGHQAARPDRTDDPVVLQGIAEQQRHRARAEDRSVRLALERIFDAYQMPGSMARFVRAHRRYRIDEILEAERRIGKYACRCRAKCCDRYLAAVLRKVAEESRVQRARRQREIRARQEDRRRTEEHRRRLKHRRDRPEDAIADALGFLRAQYRPASGELLFDGVGPGRGILAAALRTLVETSPLSACDRADIGWRRFERALEPDHRACVPAVRRLFDRVVRAILNRPKNRPRPSTSEAVSAIIRGGLPHPRPRPSPPTSLRI